MTLRVHPLRIYDDATGEILAVAPLGSTPPVSADDLLAAADEWAAQRCDYALAPSPFDQESSASSAPSAVDPVPPPGWSPLDILDRRPGITIPMNTLLFAAAAGLLLWAAGVALLMYLMRSV